MIKVVENPMMVNSDELLLRLSRQFAVDFVQEISCSTSLGRPATMEDIRPYVTLQFAKLRLAGVIPDDYEIEVWVGFKPASPNLPSTSDTFAPGITVSLPKIDLT